MRASDSARRDPVVLLALGALLLAAGAAAAVLEHINPIGLRHYVTWRTPEEARQLAIEQRRPILYAFLEQRHATSLQIERDLFADPELGPRLNREFVLVRSDPKLAAQYGAGAGSLVLTDPEGARHIAHGGYRGRAYAEQFLFGAAKTLRGAGPAEDVTRPLVEALSRIGHAGSPSFSPDARQIAFIADLSGAPQLWMTDANGSYPQLIASMEHGIDAAQWSPDGRWIAFASDRQIYVVRPDGTDVRRLSPAGSARNIMSGWTHDSLLPINTAFKTSPSMESALFDPSNGKSRMLARSPAFGVVIDVACDGQSAIVLRREGAKRSTAIVGAGAHDIVPPADNEQTLATFATLCGTPASPPAGPQASSPASHGGGTPPVQPAGRQRSTELFAVTNHNRDRSAFARIRNGTFETLWERDDAELSTAALSDDRTLAALTWNRAGRQELALLDLRTGARKPIDLPLTNIGGLRFSQDTKHLVFTGSDAQKPSDIWLLDVATGDAKQITRSSHPGVDLGKLVRPELIHFKGEDGLPLTGWLYRANGTAAVISLHGGPMQQETPAMNATYQALVAAGISVFAPNVRGSLGFGKRFMTLDDGPLRVNAIRDVKAAAGWLVQSRTATRLGIMGESYGGWLTLECVTRYPGLFAAASDAFGMIDLEAMIDEAAPEVAPMLRAEYGEDLGELSVDLRAIRTPTLVLHGMRDVIVRPEHSNKLVRELRRRNVPVEYVLFENEGHEFHQEANRVRAASAIVNWFTKHLGR